MKDGLLSSTADGLVIQKKLKGLNLLKLQVKSSNTFYNNLAKQWIYMLFFQLHRLHFALFCFLWFRFSMRFHCNHEKRKWQIQDFCFRM